MKPGMIDTKGSVKGIPFCQQVTCNLHQNTLTVDRCHYNRHFSSQPDPNFPHEKISYSKALTTWQELAFLEPLLEHHLFLSPRLIKSSWTALGRKWTEWGRSSLALLPFLRVNSHSTTFFAVTNWSCTKGPLSRGTPITCNTVCVAVLVSCVPFALIG